MIKPSFLKIGYNTVCDDHSKAMYGAYYRAEEIDAYFKDQLEQQDLPKPSPLEQRRQVLRKIFLRASVHTSTELESAMNEFQRAAIEAYVATQDPRSPERKAFEEWAKTEKGLKLTWSNGNYLSFRTSILWKGWQARGEKK